MGKQVTSVHMMSLIALDRDSRTSLYSQIYSELREAILKGQLTPGGRLPSTRDLSETLGVSRNTVKYAFEQLLAEGYLDARVGSGTFINAQLPSDFLQVRQEQIRNPVISTAQRTLSARSIMFEDAEIDLASLPNQDFAFFSVPALDHFPFELWGNLTAKQYRNLPLRMFGLVEDAIGYFPLREAIASHLNMVRGANCRPEQIVITTGAQQSLFVISQLLLDPGDIVWMEEPGYLGARMAFRASSAKVVPVPVDEHGLVIDEGMQREPNAKLIFTTPSHQFPLGSTLSLARRLELLRWAAKTGAWIIEDDFDSEYRYVGQPLSCLQGLDTDNCVIYIGTFSKSLFPSLRIGYIVLPNDLVELFKNARNVINANIPIVTQATLHQFINEGHFYQHIRRMRTLYARRLESLTDAISQYLEGIVKVGPHDAGMHLAGLLPDEISDQDVSLQARKVGIEVQPLSRFYLAQPQYSGLLFGFTAIPNGKIKENVKKLAQIIMKLE